MRNILLSIGAMILLLITVLLVTTILNLNRNSNLEQTENISNTQDIVKSDAYTPSYHKESTFSSHLPLVLIEIDGQTIKKEEIIWSKIKVIDNKNGENYLEDEYDFQTISTLKYRGNSSYLTFDKKQYRLEFYEETEGIKKNSISVMGMAKECDWVLYGPFLDMTLIRNNLLYGVSREIMDWAPDTRYCEMFLDGKYQGVYLMIENIKVSKSRLNSKKFSLIDGETSYLLKRERPDTEINVINNFGSYAGKTEHQLSISYPKPLKLLGNQKEWIRKDISKFERVLYSNKFDDMENGYATYIDVDSFVDYYIINEFSMIRDAGYLSTYIYKDLRGKLKMIVWDFNNSFDNYPWFESDPYSLYVFSSNWYRRLFQDRNFTEKVVKRYHELRKGILSEEFLLNTIDHTVLYLGNAVDRNFEVWGYTFNANLLIGDRDPKNYDEALKQLKTCIIERGRFLDDNIETLFQLAIN